MGQLLTMPVTCDICGGGGFGNLRTAAAGYDPYLVVVHKDPNVCARNLELANERRVV